MMRCNMKGAYPDCADFTVLSDYNAPRNGNLGAFAVVPSIQANIG